MKYFVVGLGNPGDEYAHTRHNVGFMAVGAFVRSKKYVPFVEEGKMSAFVARGKVGKDDVTLLLPNTYMNKSGSSVKKCVTSKKAAEKLIVVHDDIDLPLGNIKITFGRGSGGHRGVESVIRAVGTKNFVRIRVGVSPQTSGGKIKKPKGEDRVLDFLMKDFRKPEMEDLKKVFKTTTEAIEVVITEGHVAAMNTFN